MVPPDIRFAREYNVPNGLWSEMWRRKTLLDYTMTELNDYHELKTGRRLSKKALIRWVWRTEVYSCATPLIREGTECVQSTFFRHNEWRIIKELGKNLKSSVHKDTKAFI